METEIPKEELEAFRKLVRTYKKGDKIIIEGQEDTLGLLLLRKGDVKVYKELGTQRELISTLSAINFFGEISLIENKPRSATVEAASDEVIVYTFQSPDMQVLLSNPKWGPMLITRVVTDLQQRGDQLIDLRRVSNRVCADLERTLNQVTDLRGRFDKYSEAIIDVLSIITALQAALQKIIPNNDVASINQITEYLVQNRLEKVKDKLTQVPPATWEELYKAHILSKNLYQQLHKPG
jgi:CRP-like cAMP-binding protein